MDKKGAEGRSWKCSPPEAPAISGSFATLNGFLGLRHEDHDFVPGRLERPGKARLQAGNHLQSKLLPTPQKGARGSGPGVSPQTHRSAPGALIARDKWTAPACASVIQ